MLGKIGAGSSSDRDEGGLADDEDDKDDDDDDDDKEDEEVEEVEDTEDAEEEEEDDDDDNKGVAGGVGDEVLSERLKRLGMFPKVDLLCFVLDGCRFQPPSSSSSFSESEDGVCVGTTGALRPPSNADSGGSSGNHGGATGFLDGSVAFFQVRSFFARGNEAKRTGHGICSSSAANFSSGSSGAESSASANSTSVREALFRPACSAPIRERWPSCCIYCSRTSLKLRRADVCTPSNPPFKHRCSKSISKMPCA